MTSVLISLNLYEADDVDPTIVSPAINSPSTVATSSLFVKEFQERTLAVVPLVDPTTFSLNRYVPIPDIYGEDIVIVGVCVYPSPAFVNKIEEIDPLELMIAVAVADTKESPVNVIGGDEV